MQERGHQALVVHVHVREDGGNSEWMGDVGVAGMTFLIPVCAFSEVVRATYLPDLLANQISGQVC